MYFISDSFNTLLTPSKLVAMESSFMPLTKSNSLFAFALASDGL